MYYFLKNTPWNVCFQMLVAFYRWFLDEISAYALDATGDIFTVRQVKLCVGNISKNNLKNVTNIWKQPVILAVSNNI